MTVKMITYEEWQKLPHEHVDAIEKHPHRFEFGVDEDTGKAVARMTKDGITELCASLEKENNLPPGTMTDGIK